MKSMIVVALALVAVAVALPVEDKDAQVVNSNNEQSPGGSYNYGFNTDNGIQREEQGSLKEALSEDNKLHTVVVVRGSFSYTRDDGTVETIKYTADENGFRADGASVPKVESS